MLLVLTGLQRRLIYFPGPAPGPPPDGVAEVTSTTADGLDLAGWLVAHDREAPLVVMFHGNAGSRAERLPLAVALAERGIGTLLTDYRGYGGNPGSPSEDGLAADARAWADWVEANHDGPVTYLGESLGTAVAVRLATERPPDSLVLRSPFTSLTAVASHHYPFLPVGALLRDRFEVTDHLAGLDVPLVVVLGTADAIVPPRLSREVAAAGGSSTRLVEVQGADHNDAALLVGDQLIDAIVGALR